MEKSKRLLASCTAKKVSAGIDSWYEGVNVDLDTPRIWSPGLHCASGCGSPGPNPSLSRIWNRLLKLFFKLINFFNVKWHIEVLTQLCLFSQSLILIKQTVIHVLSFLSGNTYQGAEKLVHLEKVLTQCCFAIGSRLGVQNGGTNNFLTNSSRRRDLKICPNKLEISVCLVDELDFSLVTLTSFKSVLFNYY